MTLVYEGNHLVFKVSGMGPYDNNGYVIADPKSKEAYLVDAPEGIESLLKEADGFQIKGLILFLLKLMMDLKFIIKNA